MALTGIPQTYDITGHLSQADTMTFWNHASVSSSANITYQWYEDSMFPSRPLTPLEWLEEQLYKVSQGAWA